jgi:outer membrane protein W
MKVAVLTVGSLLFFLWVTAHVSFAGGPENPFGLGGRISYYSAKEDTLGDVKFELDGAALIEYNVTWFPVRLFSLEFSAGATTSELSGEVMGVPLSADFEQYPLQLTGRVHWWNKRSNFTLYGGGGVGYYVKTVKLPLEQTLAFPGLSVNSDDGFGYHAAGGIEWFFTKRWALNLDLKYIWHSAEFTLQIPGTTPLTDEFDFDTFATYIGIKFYI